MPLQCVTGNEKFGENQKVPKKIKQVFFEI